MSFVCHVVGARPQFIKLAALLPPMRKVAACRILHTGQHYDKELSAEHFSQLSLPQADWSLGVGSASHGTQTGRMMERIEKVLHEDRPSAVVAYGDTNSTIAAALTAAKLNIPVFHVEAGLRSLDRSTPEEINRVVTDRLSTLMFCPSPVAVRNLRREGLTEGIHLVGDVMLDILLRIAEGDVLNFRRPTVKVRKKGSTKTLTHRRREYYLATLHRAENVDQENRFRRMLGALKKLPRPVVFPVHPRTAKAMAPIVKGSEWGSIQLVSPTGYRETLELMANCRAVYTDSGGVQKEAYYLKTPCVTLRDVTEWEETVQYGANVLVGDDQESIIASSDRSFPDDVPEDLYGDGTASEKISKVVESCLAGNGKTA
jgi:UDP-N-acetylglucosamine 2-epimerase